MIKAACRVVESLRELGGTNLHQGLKEALADLEVDTIVVLSDGELMEALCVETFGEFVVTGG